jgi:hypothetical protein
MRGCGFYGTHFFEPTSGKSPVGLALPDWMRFAPGPGAISVSRGVGASGPGTARPSPDRSSGYLRRLPATGTRAESRSLDCDRVLDFPGAKLF